MHARSIGPRTYGRGSRTRRGRLAQPFSHIRLLLDCGADTGLLFDWRWSGERSSGGGAAGDQGISTRLLEFEFRLLLSQYVLSATDGGPKLAEYLRGSALCLQGAKV